MYARHWIGSICLALIALPAQAGSKAGVGDYSDLPRDLAAAATAYDIAQFKSDRRELERWLADDYALADADGRNLDRAEAINGALDPERTATSVVIRQQVKRVWSDGAVLGGVVDARGFDHGKAFTLHARFVDVWAKRDGRWRVIFTQIHELP